MFKIRQTGLISNVDQKKTVVFPVEWLYRSKQDWAGTYFAGPPVSSVWFVQTGISHHALLKKCVQKIFRGPVIIELQIESSQAFKSLYRFFNNKKLFNQISEDLTPPVSLIYDASRVFIIVTNISCPRQWIMTKIIAAEVVFLTGGYNVFFCKIWIRYFTRGWCNAVEAFALYMSSHTWQSSRFGWGNRRRRLFSSF